MAVHDVEDAGELTIIERLEPTEHECGRSDSRAAGAVRTTPEQPTFQSLTDSSLPDGQAFSTAVDPFTCSRYEICVFTSEAAVAGVRYFGLCCGTAPHHVRAMAEALGRTPPASRYSADMSKHVYLGDDSRLTRHDLAYRSEL